MEQPKIINNTFLQDFTIADHFGLAAIQDTYNRSFEAHKDSIEYLDALVVVLENKFFAWCEKDEDKARLYGRLSREVDAFILDRDEDGFKNFTREEICYYLVGATG